MNVLNGYHIRPPKSVCTSTIVVSSNPLSPVLSTSAMQTHDPQCHGPSASLLSTEETQENTEEDPDAPEPTVERNM
jgi:hypothetical protein